MNTTVNLQALGKLRHHERYGPILDRALRVWFDPLMDAKASPQRHGYGSYPGGDSNRTADPNLIYEPCKKMSCCLLGAARVGLPASLGKYAAALGITLDEVTAITAGFDAENEPELERAAQGFPKWEDATRFGHAVAVALGLPFDCVDPSGRPVLASFVAIIDGARLIDGVPALLTVQRTAKGVGLSIPGGSLEPGESPAAAAARELWEEIGAVVPIADLVHIDTQEWEDRGPIVGYVVDIAAPNGVQLDVETVNRVYQPSWHPYTVLQDPAVVAFPEWSRVFCEHLARYLEAYGPGRIAA